jgi:hypothetical protein
MHRLPRLTVALCGGTALTAALAPAALAAPAPSANPPVVDQWRTSGSSATVSWVEVDHEDSSGRPGSVHVGGLWVQSFDGTSVVPAGSLADWDCVPGALPWEADGAGCSLVTQYEVSQDAVELRLDERAGTATVTGTVTFSDLAGSEGGQWTAPVDLSWRTEGEREQTTSHTVELTPAFRFVMHQRTDTWPTVLSAGTVGTLVLGDEAGELNEERLYMEDSRYVVWSRSGGVDDDGDGGDGDGGDGGDGDGDGGDGGDGGGLG